MKQVKTRSFNKDFRGLPGHVQEKAKKAFQLFKQDPQHPSLQIEKLEGTQGIWHGWIDYQYRWTFEYRTDPETGETICIHRRIGKHDILRKP
ncbi:MAG: hypothetical protein FJY85_13725 [Deltaproteobacteria bacterium]|nr:hypothetical protein [Deltaproteobacteria bacterium]MBM4431415.1 hypothetical protein [Chloroflexota bacterium]